MLPAMSRMALLLVLATACSKSASHPDKTAAPAPSADPGPAPAAAPAPAAPTAATPPAPDNPQFHLKAEEGTLEVGKAEGKAGSEATATIKVEPAEGYHVSLVFPIALTLEAPAGVKLAKAELVAGGHDKSKGDATEFTEKMLQFDVKATPDKPGSYEIKGTFRFGVCDKDSCHPKKQPITIQVAAN